jgi:hypothetical protein
MSTTLDSTFTSAKPFVWTAVHEALHQSDLAKRRAEAWVRASETARDNKWAKAMTVLSSALSEQAKINAEIVSAMASPSSTDPRLQADLAKVLAVVEEEKQDDARRQVELAQLNVELAQLNIQSVEIQKVLDNARLQVELEEKQADEQLSAAAKSQEPQVAEPEVKIVKVKRSWWSGLCCVVAVDKY